MATGEATGKREIARSIAIRKCQGLEEMRACVALQKEVWNFSDAELVPLRLFVVAEKIGGQVIGAFEGKELVGFALAVPGARGGRAYLHSHMLAVRKEYRNAGLGRRIKLFQRDDALARQGCRGRRSVVPGNSGCGSLGKYPDRIGQSHRKVGPHISEE